MGYWTLTIEGMGCHHNKQVEADADRMAQQFIGEMRARGHNILHASLAFGGHQDLQAGGYCDLRGAKIDRSGKPTCIGQDQLYELEADGKKWTNENFRKLMDSVDVLLAERETLKLKAAALTENMT